MACSYREQFAQIVSSLRPTHHAHLCDGDESTAMVWNDSTEITARLSLRGDEVWILAGSGLLVRFVAPSDGEFDREAVCTVVDEVLTGGAVEFFAAASGSHSARVPTGFTLPSGSVSSGDLTTSDFAAQLAGPFARADAKNGPLGRPVQISRALWGRCAGAPCSVLRAPAIASIPCPWVTQANLVVDCGELPNA